MIDLRDSVRRRRRRIALCAIAVAASLGVAIAQPADMPQRPVPNGYLGASGVPDEKVLLPPPPTESSLAGRQDMEIFRSTRAQQNTPRWSLAAGDAAADPASVARDFSCALGVRLDLGRAPALAHLLGRSIADAFQVVGPPKERYARPRPFRRASGAVCVAMSPEFAKSGSYPSGHAAVGWLYALVLSELAPDRSGPILARGRSFGDSRVICGVHYASDVEAGRMAAAGLFAVLQSSADFQSDASAARAELANLRHEESKPDAASCAVAADAEQRSW